MKRAPRKSNRTPEEKQMAAQYNPWKRSRKQNILLTREEYVQLWINSGLWNQRGLGIGKATVWYNPTLESVTISDCSIQLRTEEMLAQAHGREVKIKVVKPPRVKKEKALQFVGTYQKKASVPKPPKMPKPHKPYSKSTKQMQKEILGTHKKPGRPAKNAKEEELNVAVNMFYDNSTNPLNNKIREVAKIMPTNYSVYNLLTKKELKVDPKRRTEMTD